MRAVRQPVPPPPPPPIEIALVMTEAEAESLKDMMHWNVSIPAALVKESYSRQEVKLFMGRIVDALSAAGVVSGCTTLRDDG